ncbi:inositol-tetrakisphosphate 1-kinase 3-like isoform X1 [Silene latifolia]|uniref:inositol-tetrakisphosphate 1-kinase 3-like isoform X1 n=1 Tax=Silene latifolia TaxID=37657 RepID=UPI003D786580
MRLNGEIREIMEDDEELNSISNSVDSGFAQKVVVGYALTAKKKESFLQPKFEVIARKKGILLVPIDQNQPLSDQGPFDVVLHKLLGSEWSQILEDYRLKHPEVTVLDPPYAIQCVHNRQSMLEEVAALNLADSCGRVCVPKQLVVEKDSSSIPSKVAKAGLKLPLVAKPLYVDGTAKSHKLFLAYDNVSLSNLEPPLVLQEFVNHGGVMFKVYVVGDAIKVTRRFSLPDVCKRELSKNVGVFQFPRVSCAAANADEADLEPGVAELPPRPLLERLVGELRLRMGLQLFNIDMIREHGTQDMFYVIDINYFPGYGKVPDYEHIFTDFLVGLADRKARKQLCT